MPATWASLTVRHRLGSDPFDPRANILAGAAYLRAMWDRYGDVRLMLAAYNAGPGRADAYVAGRRGPPDEPRAYVAKIAPELPALLRTSSRPDERSVRQECVSTGKSTTFPNQPKKNNKEKTIR